MRKVPKAVLPVHMPLSLVQRLDAVLSDIDTRSSFIRESILRRVEEIEREHADRSLNPYAGDPNGFDG